MVRALLLPARRSVASLSVRGSGAAAASALDASPFEALGGVSFFVMPHSPAARQVAMATYGLMSAAVCRYSSRVPPAPPRIARMARVGFSSPPDAVSGVHAPGT